jgi:AAA+ superfamily predicted ATPase
MTGQAACLELAFFARVRLRARRRALWLRSLWEAEAVPKNVGIGHEEIDRILTSPAEAAEAEASFYERDSEARALGRLIDAADEGAAGDQRWRGLCHLFCLNVPESDLLALAAAVSADPGFARVCGYLHDDVSACFATPMLAQALFQWAPDMHVCSGSALARWRLATVPENAPHPCASNTPWIADPYMVRWLAGETGIDPVLADSIARIVPTDTASLDRLDPHLLDGMRDFFGKSRGLSGGSAVPVEIEITGPRGAGKRTLAAQFCAELGAALLVVDAAQLIPAETAPAVQTTRLIHALRAGRLEGAALYWQHAEVLDDRARALLDGVSELTFFGMEAPPSRNSIPVHAARQQFRIRGLTQEQRARLWRRFTDVPAPDSAREWNLSPAEIRAAANVAHAGPVAVLQACHRLLQRDHEGLLTKLECPYTWDDIVVPAAMRRQLEELTAQARLQTAVLEDWGFGRLCPMGHGLSALFAGPSGTGKTMAAQVVARTLDRELCRVDLAEVVNKYIGETEKRLKRVFDACERAAVVLFFDEADALFGQRTQVKDSHDRYANIQIDYLLQRMEQFDGIALLSTNRVNDLDSAFMRRLRFVVNFVPPGPEERLALWRLALLQRSPAGAELLDDIDWQWLADKLILTGADIKAIALAAAFLARAESARIRMDHLLHAAKREMAKHGASWRTGEWSPKPNA